MGTGFTFDKSVLEAALRRIYSRDFHPMTDIEQNLFHEFLRTFNTAADQGFLKSVDPDDDFRAAIRHGNAVFSAFKTHRLQNDMAARLLDENGDLKPFEQWKKDVRSIASHQCGAWLRTEYDTAVIRARQAADWKQFERERDVLPNLKWLPSTSVNPGEDHRPFWGTILPIDHPFWSKHRPGDRWNCKCDLTSTDEPPTRVPGETEKDNPHRGLENNPGKDGALMSDSHPYYPSDCQHCAFYRPSRRAYLRTFFENRVKDCYNCPYIDGCLDRMAEIKRTMKERKKEARKAVQGKMLTNPDFPEKIMVSRASVDEWTNQPFMYMAEKHQMLLEIERVLTEAEYLGPADKHKDKDRLLQSHLFRTHIEDIDAYIIVWEFDTGEFILHSISDSPNILKYLKRK